MRLLAARAVCAAFVVTLALAAPAAGGDPLQAAAEVGQRLDLSALAAHGKAQGAEARLAPSDVARLKAIGAAFGRSGDTAELMRGWQAYLVAAQPAPGDVDALAGLVLRESYLQAAADLAGEAERLRAINQKRAAIRDQAPGTPTLRLLPGTTQMFDGSSSAQLVSLRMQTVMQRHERILAMTANLDRQMNDAALASVRRMR